MGSHQLQVVYDDQVDAVLALQAPGFCPRLENGDPRGIVDVDRGLGQLAYLPRQAEPVVVAQAAGSKLVQIDPGLEAEQPLRDLLLGHFEAEDRHPFPGLDRGVAGHAQGQRRLADARTRREDDEIPRLQAGCQVVEIGKACVDPGDCGVAVVGPLDLLDGSVQDRLDAFEAARKPPFREGEDPLLRPVEELVHLGPALEGPVRNQRRGLDQGAAQSPVEDDVCVVNDVGRGGDLRRQGRQVDQAPHLLDLAPFLELLADGELVDSLAAIEEGDHGRKDPGVRVVVEAALVENLDGAPDRPLIDQHGADDRLLDVDGLRRQAVEAAAVLRPPLVHGDSPLSGTVTAPLRRTGA